MSVAIYRTMIFLIKKIPDLAVRNDKLYKIKRVSLQPQSNETRAIFYAIINCVQIVNLHYPLHDLHAIGLGVNQS